MKYGCLRKCRPFTVIVVALCVSLGLAITSLGIASFKTGHRYCFNPAGNRQLAAREHKTLHIGCKEIMSALKETIKMEKGLSIDGYDNYFGVSGNVYLGIKCVGNDVSFVTIAIYGIDNESGGCPPGSVSLVCDVLKHIFPGNDNMVQEITSRINLMHTMPMLGFLLKRDGKDIHFGYKKHSRPRIGEFVIVVSPSQSSSAEEG